MLLSALFQDGRKADVHSYATAGKPKFQISESSIQDWKVPRYFPVATLRNSTWL